MITYLRSDLITYLISCHSNRKLSHLRPHQDRSIAFRVEALDQTHGVPCMFWGFHSFSFSNFDWIAFSRSFWNNWSNNPSSLDWNFGRTQLATSSGVYTLGRFVCTGTVAINRLSTSCQDLWLLIGHNLNGVYYVRGNKMMESVYCDFTKLHSDAGE